MIEVRYKSKTTQRIHTVQCDKINITDEHIECISFSDMIKIKIEDINHYIDINRSIYYIFRCTIIDDSLSVSEIITGLFDNTECEDKV